MKQYALIAAAGLIAYAAWRYAQQSEDTGADVLDLDTGTSTDTGTDTGGLLTDAGQVLSDAAQSTAGFIDDLTGGILKISSMARVPRSVLSDRNVQAFLRVIRAGEGTSDEAGYRRIFGGQLFTSFADHPRITVSKSGYTSTAAGAYQFIASSWDETKRVMGLSDFTPASQDYAAVGRIAARGALDDVLAGRFDVAIKKVAREWASMPGSPYGQPTISLDKARTLYASAGGDFSKMA
jgi:muramidase (phage lysozyme)